MGQSRCQPPVLWTRDMWCGELHTLHSLVTLRVEWAARPWAWGWGEKFDAQLVSDCLISLSFDAVLTECWTRVTKHQLECTTIDHGTTIRVLQFWHWFLICKDLYWCWWAFGFQDLCSPKDLLVKVFHSGRISTWRQIVLNAYLAAKISRSLKCESACRQ